MIPRLLTVHDVAFLLQLSPHTIYDLVQQDKIPHVHLTGMRAIRFKWADVERWTNSRKRVHE